jgi:ABC-type sugar transport system ATPase subunit
LITGQGSPTVFQQAPESRAGAAATTAETVLLGVQRLTKAGSYYDISFVLHRNEIVGLAGLRGSGRTEILKTVSGILHQDAGKLILAGKARKVGSPAEALKQGIAYLPEDRDREGLIEKLSVRFNLSLSSIASLRKGMFLDRKMELSRTQELVDLLSIETPSTEEEVLYLSGGNKQKVVVGRIISRKPKIFLLDEPTKGIDIGTKAGILEMVRTKLRQNAGVLITSPGLEDLIAVCDRIIVLHEGRMVSEFLKRDFDESKIYLAMQGMRLQPPGVEER